MKSFTAKQFVKRPADVYEAAREEGIVTITHDRFKGKFELYYVNGSHEEISPGDIIEVCGQKLRVIPYKKATG